MTGKIEAIYIAEVKGDPMQRLSRATVTPTGIAGDRYEKGAGTWGKRPERRHLTLIEAEKIEAANKKLDTPFRWQETRRNIVVSNFNLNELVNKRFWIGLVLVEGVELCTPCKHPGNLVGKSNFETAFEDRGGLRVKILQPGNIAIGDELKLST